MENQNKIETSENNSIDLAAGCSLKMPILEDLPKHQYWDKVEIYKWQGYWLAIYLFDGIMKINSHFEARNDDILLASPMKSGTTWLKALCFSMMGKFRQSHAGAGDTDLLMKKVPHELVRTIEFPEHEDFSSMVSPRILHTHLPYNLIPNSIKLNSDCKIVYITRNPKDNFVSQWHFWNNYWFQNKAEFPIEKAFDDFCNGVSHYGPYFDHVLEYWNESLKFPDKILFLKFEELKKDSRKEVKKLAKFLGKSFNDEEIDEILEQCSFDRLKNLEVNKTGESPWEGLPNSSFFRRGVVGDWRNYLTPEMGERLDEIMRSKLEGSGLILE